MKVLGKTVLLSIVETPIEGVSNTVITKAEDIQPKFRLDLIVAYIGDEVTKIKIGDKVYIGKMGTAQYLPDLQEIGGEYFMLTKEDNIIAIL